jgi:hypothetical protein
LRRVLGAASEGAGGGLGAASEGAGGGLGSADGGGDDERWCLACLTGHGWAERGQPHAAAETPGRGCGVHTDSRFRHAAKPEDEGSDDGTEVRVTAREGLRSPEVGACVHVQRLRVFAQVDWHPGGTLELSVVAGVGWELGLGPRRERVEGAPDEMRFRPENRRHRAQIRERAPNIF